MEQHAYKCKGHTQVLQSKNIVIAVLVLVLVVQGAGIVWLWCEERSTAAAAAEFQIKNLAHHIEVCDTLYQMQIIVVVVVA